MEEKIIWQQFTEGDEQAYAVIYNRYVQLLYKYGCRITTDTDVVKEAVQLVFISIWNSRKNLKPPASVKNYLLKALRHEIFRVLKQSGKEEIPDEYLFETEPSPETTIINLQSTKALQDLLLSKIEKLPVRQREAIFLRFYNEMSFEEIAAVMNIELRSVYKLIYKAIENLQRLLR